MGRTHPQPFKQLEQGVTAEPLLWNRAADKIIGCSGMLPPHSIGNLVWCLVLSCVPEAQFTRLQEEGDWSQLWDVWDNGIDQLAG